VTLDAKFGEQFKRYLQRNRFLHENDPILIDKAPATNPSVLDTLWPVVPPPVTAGYHQQGQGGQQTQYPPSLGAQQHEVVDMSSRSILWGNQTHRQYVHEGKDEARLFVSPLIQQQPYYYQQVTTTLHHNSNPPLPSTSDAAVAMTQQHKTTTSTK